MLYVHYVYNIRIQEDRKIVELVEKHGAKKWSLIAAEFPGRIGKICCTYISYYITCYSYTYKCIPSGLCGQVSVCITIFLTHTPIHTYTGKQCRERWHNHLNPHVNKAAWTEAEDRLIILAHYQLGNRWADIAKKLPGIYAYSAVYLCVYTSSTDTYMCHNIRHIDYIPYILTSRPYIY